MNEQWCHHLKCEIRTELLFFWGEEKWWVCSYTNWVFYILIRNGIANYLQVMLENSLQFTLLAMAVDRVSFRKNTWNDRNYHFVSHGDENYYWCFPFILVLVMTTKQWNNWVNHQFSLVLFFLLFDENAG